MTRIDSWQDFRQRARHFRLALAHWGFKQYVLLAAMWVMLSSPMLIRGHGVLSLLFPLAIIAGVWAFVISIVPALKWWGRRAEKLPDTSHLAAEFVHDQLGKLILDRRTASYRASFAWKGRPCELQLRRLDEESVATAVHVLSNRSPLEQQVDSLIVTRLLPTAVDWTPEGATVPTASRILDAISLTTLSIEDEGRYSLYFDDADLVGGHGLVVEGDVRQGPFDAELFG